MSKYIASLSGENKLYFAQAVFTSIDLRLR